MSKKIDYSIQLLGNVPYITKIEANGDVVSIPLTEFLKEGKAIGVVSIVKGRTMAQNRAIHVLYSRIATILNDAGLSVHRVLFSQQNKKIDKAFRYAEEKYPKLKPFFEKMRAFIGENEKAMDWNTLTVKELIWRPIQKAITGKESTTKLNKEDEITVVYQTISKKLSEDFGIDIGGFPNWESLVQNGVYK